MAKAKAANNFYFRVYNVPEKISKMEKFQRLEVKFDGILISSTPEEFDEKKFTHHIVIRSAKKVKKCLFV